MRALSPLCIHPGHQDTGDLYHPMHRLLFFALFIFTASFTPANADWINLTGAETSPNIAEIYVLDDRVRVQLEVYIQDLEVFEELVPDDWIRDQGINRPTEEKRLQQFAEHKLKIVADGQRLTAEVRLVEPRLRQDRQSPFAGMVNPYTRQRIPEAPADKRVLYAEIEYRFQGRPQTITFTPPLDDEGRAMASIGFIAYHKSVPIIDFRYLSAEVVLNLDWRDPWYSKFSNPNLKRHHKSALMSFLYVEPYEVRHEILVRVKDLENWMDLGLRGDEYIEADELDPLKRRVGEFLLLKNPVHINGEPAKPILDRTSFVTVSITGIQLLESAERLEISTAIVGIIIAYITDGLPNEVTVDWELFTDQIERVPVSAIDPAGPLPSFVDPNDRVHKWTNFLKNYEMPTVADIEADAALTDINIPVVSLACVLALIPLGWRITKQEKKRMPIIAAAGLTVIAVATFPFATVSIGKPGVIAPTLQQVEAKTVLQSLLDNVYRAFDFREEEDVYDKLAHSVTGELLTEFYLQSRRSFEIQRAGGAQAKVKEVEVLQVDAADNPERPYSYDLNARWSALGTVGHWGHVHTRKNVYDAVVTVDVVDGVWKITELDLLEEKRVDPYGKPSAIEQTSN